MLDLQSGGLMKNHNQRHETWILYNCAWVSSNHITTHSSIVSFFFLCWLNIHWSNKFNSWQWCPSISIFYLIAIIRLPTYCKLNINIKCPPPYKCVVCDYNKATAESIKNLLSLLIGNSCSVIRVFHKQVSFSMRH